MTVFVVQEAIGKNLLPAAKFGDIKILLPAGQVAYSPAPTVRRLREKLSHFSDNDYLLLMGDPAAIAIAGAVACERNNGKMRLLKWDRQERQYFPIDVDIYTRMT